MLNQCSLVLESITLAQMVELVVKVLVDLTTGTVLDQKATKDSKAAHPNYLAIKTSEPHLRPRVWVLQTLAYEHQPYPSFYQNHGVSQFVEQR